MKLGRLFIFSVVAYIAAMFFMGIDWFLPYGTLQYFMCGTLATAMMTVFTVALTLLIVLTL